MSEETNTNAARASRDEPSRRTRLRRRLLIPLLLFASLLVALPLVINSRPAASESKAEALDAELAPAQPDYSRFSHTNPQHARLPCLLCHRREDNSPRPVRSAGHTPCTGCHTEQFADNANPICTICHNPGSTDVKPFPPLRTHNARFDHAVHASGAARPQTNCAACHRPERRGVALSIPAGLDAHTTCFQCHQPRAQSNGRDISSCSTCHQQGSYRRTPESAQAFRVNFSHAEHTRKNLSCSICHSVRAGMPQGRQVTSPQPLMHHASPRAQSCMTCHNNRRAFGGDDFSDCKRCHEGNAWHF